MSHVDTEESNLSLPNQARVFIGLKDHGLVQKILINTLLIKKNSSIDDLASLLHIDSRKLHQVYHGGVVLKGKESLQLVTLFYISIN